MPPPPCHAHGQVQAAALGALPRLPHHRLAAALGEGEAEGRLGGRVLPCLQSSSKEVHAVQWSRIADMLRSNTCQSRCHMYMEFSASGSL